MSSNKKITEAKSKIRDGINILRAESIDDLLTALLEELVPQSNGTSGEPAEKNNRHFRFWIWIFVCFISALAAATFVSSSSYLEAFTDLEFDLRSVLFFLGFVVALASYIASVGRELVKDLRMGIADDRTATKESIFRLVQVEASLVLLGLFTMLYAVVFLNDTGWEWSVGGQAISFCPGVFLITYLFLILLWLARLHLRVWRMTKPWALYE